MVLDKCPKAGCQATVKRKGWKPFRSVYGVEYNVKVVRLQYICAEHGGCSPSAETYWEERMPREQGEFCSSVPSRITEDVTNRVVILPQFLPRQLLRGSSTTLSRKYDPKAQWISLWKIYIVSLKFSVWFFYVFLIWLIDTCCRAAYAALQMTWNPVLCRRSSRANSDVVLQQISRTFPYDASTSPDREGW